MLEKQANICPPKDLYNFIGNICSGLTEVVTYDLGAEFGLQIEMYLLRVNLKVSTNQK